MLKTGRVVVPTSNISGLVNALGADYFEYLTFTYDELTYSGIKHKETGLVLGVRPSANANEILYGLFTVQDDTANLIMRAHKPTSATPLNTQYRNFGYAFSENKNTLLLSCSSSNSNSASNSAGYGESTLYIITEKYVIFDMIVLDKDTLENVGTLSVNTYGVAGSYSTSSNGQLMSIHAAVVSSTAQYALLVPLVFISTNGKATIVDDVYINFVNYMSSVATIEHNGEYYGGAILGYISDNYIRAVNEYGSNVSPYFMLKG